MANRDPSKRGASRHTPSTASSTPASAPAVNKGAAKHKVNIAGQGRSWLRHHKATARDSYNRLWQTPIPTLMTLAVLAIALALPGLMYVGLKNVNQLSGEWKGDPKISLYLQKELSDQQAEAFSQKMLLRQDLIAVELVTKDQGLLEFQAMSEFADVLNFLDSNPLPAVVVIQARDGRKQVLQQLQQEFSKLPEVDQAVLDMVWVERLAAFVELANRLVMVLGCLLAFSVLLVVGNTIRLSIENRKDEIQVAKLVGATDSWVQRPFIYTGFWFGLLGTVIAWLFIQISLLLVSTPVSEIASLYQSGFDMQGLGFSDSLVLVIAGILLGLLGSKLAVSRHLREIEPK